jgi:hypothetical protein
MPIIQTDKELRPRDADDHYPTPNAFVQSALNLVPDHIHVSHIIDPGAGSGAFGTSAKQRWPDAKITGIETRDIPKPAAYTYWLNMSYVGLSLGVQVDLVIGNPPYKYAEDAVRFGWEHLRPGGYMVYLLRLAFLEGQKRHYGLWREMPPDHVAVCSNRPSFTGDWVWHDVATGFSLDVNETVFIERGNPEFIMPYRIQRQQRLAEHNIQSAVHEFGGAELRFITDGRTDATAYAFFCWQKPEADYAAARTAVMIPTMSFVMSEE